MNYQMNYQWALARYHVGDETGKKVIGLANEGIGYHIMNKNRGKVDDLIVAFKFTPLDIKTGLKRELPDHLELASVYQSDKLDEWDIKRSGVPDMTERQGIKSVVMKPAFTNIQNLFK